MSVRQQVPSKENNYPMIYLLILLVFLLPQGHIVASVENNSDESQIPADRLERIFIYLLNKERTQHGLLPLAPNGSLLLVARHHSQKMMEENKLSHEFPNYMALDERITSAGLSFKNCAENVAQGQDCTMKIIHDSLMNSPNHRSNILSTDYKQIGIGIVKKEECIYVTQVFASLYTPVESRRMEEELRLGIAQNSRLRPYAPSKHSSHQIALCRDMAQRLIEGASPDQLFIEHPEAFITLIRFSGIDVFVIYTLIRAITPLQHLHWELGVAYSQSKKYPNGSYAVALYIGKE